MAFEDELHKACAPDASFAELRARYMCDDRLHVPATVFNAIRNRTETV